MFRFVSLALSLVLALAALTACSSDSETSPVEDTTIELRITDDPPSEPVEEPVALGSMLTLVVTADVDSLVHVHGYEKELDVLAGQTAETTFKANIAGVLEVETHDPDGVWIKLVVS